MIVVSEPSAEAVRRVRTGRSPPARSRSSAAHNDIPRHTDVQPSAFTPKRSCQVRGVLPVALHLQAQGPLPARPKCALAGRAGLRDGRHKRQAHSVGWGGCGIPSTSPRATTRLPGGRPGKLGGRLRGCCPRGAAWSGYARSTGCHTAPSVQDRHWLPGIGKASRHPARHRTGRGGKAPRLAQTVGHHAPPDGGSGFGTKSAVGDHLGTTRPARGQTPRTSTGRAHGAGTTVDQRRCLLPRPGGQGVAGSNPVVPTGVGSPLSGRHRTTLPRRPQHHESPDEWHRSRTQHEKCPMRTRVRPELAGSEPAPARPAAFQSPSPGPTPAPAETPSPEPEQQPNPAVTEWIDHRSGDAAPGSRVVGLCLSTGCHTAPSVQDHQWLQASRRHHDTRYAIVRARHGMAPRLAPTVGMTLRRTTEPGSGRRVRLGTTWGPHALHVGRRPARRLVVRTALTPSLTCIDGYSHVLGVKGRRFESCRPDGRNARSEPCLAR